MIRALTICAAAAATVYFGGCSGGGSGGAFSSASAGYENNLTITAVIYDTNLTATTVDDRIEIFFDRDIDPASVPADIASAFVIDGGGSLSADSVADFQKGWPYRMRINPGATSVAFVPGTTTVALAEGVLRDSNSTYPTIFPASDVYASRILLQSGQTLSYDALGNEVSTALARDDGHYRSGKSRSYSRDAANGIVTDAATGLMWQDDGNVTDSWSSSLCGAASSGGFSDWRLPAVSELSQLVDYNRTATSIDPVFVNTMASRYWSITGDARITVGTTKAWVNDFLYGHNELLAKSENHYVRCVRDAAGPSETAGLYLREDENGTVLDASTGLEWQDNVLVSGKTWAQAITYCEGLFLDGKGDWRLPNVNELVSVVDYSRSEPALDAVFSVYGGGPYNSNGYWTSTSRADNAYLAWGVGFNDGQKLQNDKTNTLNTGNVRCVRNMW